MYAGNRRKLVSYVTIIAALSFTAFSYQNCARAKFGVDPSAKNMALDKEDVFGVDPVTPIDNPTGVDPTVGSKNPMDLNFTFLCSNRKSDAAGTNLVDAAALKAVIVNGSGQKACEVAGDFKNMILNKKKISFAPCAGLVVGKYTVYLVESTATSDYAKKSLTEDDIKFEVLASGDYKIANSKIEILYDLNKDNSSYNTLNAASGKLSTAATQKLCEKRASPLIISMDSSSRGIQLSSPMDGIQFDILGQRSDPAAHAKKQISWMVSGQEYYFIVLPKDGVVSGVDEMFGDNTRGPDGKYAANGYLALAKYDDDGDNLITPDDEVYSKLRVWNDLNRNGISEPSELFTLAEKKITVIDLNYDKRYKEQDAYGNQTLMKSVVKTEDGQLHLLFDIWFRYVNLPR
ncbi:MAG: hypothetical protein H7326_07045 [Bdellovibrionaceae bacterium]|nr:hypothetical protein [Pseudobdellovibrionaceae bacterium]